MGVQPVSETGWLGGLGDVVEVLGDLLLAVAVPDGDQRVEVDGLQVGREIDCELGLWVQAGHGGQWLNGQGWRCSLCSVDDADGSGGEVLMGCAWCLEGDVYLVQAGRE